MFSVLFVHQRIWSPGESRMIGSWETINTIIQYEVGRKLYGTVDGGMMGWADCNTISQYQPTYIPLINCSKTTAVTFMDRGIFRSSFGGNQTKANSKVCGGVIILRVQYLWRPSHSGSTTVLSLVSIRRTRRDAPGDPSTPSTMKVIKSLIVTVNSLVFSKMKRSKQQVIDVLMWTFKGSLLCTFD